MSRSKSAIPSYDPTAQYRVELACRVDLFGQALYPGHDVVLRGDVLANIDQACIKAATLVQSVEA